MRLPSTAFTASAALLLLAGCLSSPSSDQPVPGAGATTPATDCLAGLAGLDLQTATLADLQAALTSGTITSVQLVDAYATRVAAFDALDGPGPKVNSIQEVSATARAQAAALDAERAAGHVRGPLHGIPVLLKDNVGTLDEPTTAGNIGLATNVPPADAAVTARLRDAGAIILGKTKLSEFAHWMALEAPSGWSSLGGQVVNAYNGGDPSGSSSGSGVATSMAFSAAAIGTETSGSILSPSNANSVVGVKPTTGLVSRTGIIPIAKSFDTAGPMARNVADAAAVLGAIAGTDPSDPRTADADRHLPAGRDYVAGLSLDGLKGVRLGYEPRSDNAIFDQSLKDLEAAGAVLVPIDGGNSDSVSILELPLLFNEFKFGLNDYLANVAGEGLPVHDLTEIIVYDQQHPDRFPYGQDLLITSDATPGLDPLSDVSIIPVLAANRRAADDLFASNGVAALIGPNAPYTGLGAAAGYPTVTVPAGYDGSDPQGLSFFGPAWSEPDLLRFAYAYEQASHARQPPTAITPSLLEGVCDGAASAAPQAVAQTVARAD
jgi:amidase